MAHRNRNTANREDAPPAGGYLAFTEESYEQRAVDYYYYFDETTGQWLRRPTPENDGQYSNARDSNPRTDYTAAGPAESTNPPAGFYPFETNAATDLSYLGNAFSEYPQYPAGVDDEGFLVDYQLSSQAGTQASQQAHQNVPDQGTAQHRPRSETDTRSTRRGPVNHHRRSHQSEPSSRTGSRHRGGRRNH